MTNANYIFLDVQAPELKDTQNTYRNYHGFISNIGDFLQARYDQIKGDVSSIRVGNFKENLGAVEANQVALSGNLDPRNTNNVIDNNNKVQDERNTNLNLYLALVEKVLNEIREMLNSTLGLKRKYSEGMAIQPSQNRVGPAPRPMQNPQPGERFPVGVPFNPFAESNPTEEGPPINKVPNSAEIDQRREKIRSDTKDPVKSEEAQKPSSNNPKSKVPAANDPAAWKKFKEDLGKELDDMIKSGNKTLDDIKKRNEEETKDLFKPKEPKIPKLPEIDTKEIEKRLEELKNPKSEEPNEEPPPPPKEPTTNPSDNIEPPPPQPNPTPSPPPPPTPTPTST